MSRKMILVPGLVLLLAAGLLGCGSAPEKDPGDGHGGEAQLAKGPHGGRLHVDGDFAAEVTIFERGVPPQFRVYCF